MGKHYCIFCAHYLPNLGGVERFTYNLAKKLLNRGDQVTVVTSNVQQLAAQENAEGVQVYRLPCYRLLNGRFPVLKKNREFRELEQAIDQQHYDFVIVNTRFYVHSLYGVKFAHKRRIPSIVIEHGTSHLSIESPLFDRMGQWFEHFITHRVKRYCHRFYGVSQNCCEWLKHFGIQPLGTVYNAIDMENIQGYLDHPACSYREEYGIPEDAVVVTYTGRLVREKGILNLMEAVDRLNREREQPLFLMIAGDGELRQEVEQKLTAQTILLGKIDFAHVVALLKQTDIFCLPTVYPEGFPTSVLEAAACQCFIITTDRGGSKELVQDDSYGIIMQGNTPDEICQSLSRALADEEQRKNAIAKSYRRLMEHFTWDIVSEHVREIAQKACSEKES